ncbi:MAG: DnaJ domain-containing protein [Anaerolineae bacterium]|jgi:Ca-activated chloride channel family protein
MEFEQDFYATLGVAVNADEQAIKRAYRRLARKYHPDVSQEKDAAERFREIQEAYEFLIDPMQREAYNHWRRKQGLDQPLPLILRVTPSQKVLPCLAESQVLYVLLELLASEEIASQRLPLNLALVLDRSTSMKGARLQQVKEAARYIVEQMGAQDVLSIVAFDDRAEIVLPGRRGVEQSAARMAISNIQASGGTEILKGLKLGWQQLKRWSTPDQLNHILLLTDGQTYGDEEGCLEMAKQAAKDRISMTLMGVGSDWNDDLLDQMAALSGAPDASIYIDSTSKIVKTFHDRVHGLGTVFARDVTLSVHMGEGVSLKESFRVSPQITPIHFVDGQAALGMLLKEDPQAIILELIVEAQSPGEHRLLQAQIAANVPALGKQQVHAQHTLSLPFDTTLGRRSSIPPDIVSAMGKLTIYKMQERAMGEIEMGQIEPAVTRLKTMATRLLDIGEVELARAALLEAGRLAQTGSLSAAGRKKIRYGTRGLTIVPKEVHYD